MAITATMIKELRTRSGAGLMDCKKTLIEAAGDIDAAIQLLRKKGIAMAGKKSSRIAAEGIIVAANNNSANVLVEINCETDFVAKDSLFKAYASSVANAILANLPSDMAAVSAITLDDGNTVEAACQNLIAKIGENINIRRFAVVPVEGNLVSVYLHAARIGVLVKLRGGDEQLGRDLAMHIAASRPLCISEQDISASVLASERAIFVAQSEASGKPAAIIQIMVDGKMKKFINENTLLGQAFVKNPQESVAQLVKSAGATVEQMVRFEVGEGLEKRSDDFVAEVLSQAGINKTPS